MEKDKTSEKHIETIRLTLDGELIEGGSIDYKTLLDVLDGTVGAIEGTIRATNYKHLINFNVRPPKEKCFEISLDVIEWIGAVVPLFGQAGSIQDILKIFLEYLKIKKALRGEELKSENIQKNENGQVVVKNVSGSVVYQDNRNIVNINVINNINKDSSLNRKLDKVAKAIEDNKKVDNLSFSLDKQGEVIVPRVEAEYLRYQERLEQKPNMVVGYIRKIDNQSFRGTLIIQEEGRNKNVEFDLDIKDIKLLDKIVSNLAYAEADKVRVVLTGEQVYDSHGKLKKVIVNDVDIPDSKFDI